MYKVFYMSLNSESKFSKIASSVKKMVISKKNVEDCQSDIETTSTGSNESELSLQISTIKPSTPDSSDTKNIKDSAVKYSKSLRKKFLRHFPTVEQDEQVIDRYLCALLGDILLQGHLYITTNYFGFYSNVFGYVTKILIPILTVKDITKEKTAKIVPNAIGIVTTEQKHIFGSFLSRDSTLAYMRKIWQKAISESPELIQSELAEEEIDSSDGEQTESEKDFIEKTKITSKNLRKNSQTNVKTVSPLRKISRHSFILPTTISILILLYISASIMLYRIHQIQNKYSIALEDVTTSDSNMVYNDLLQWQSKLHSKSEGALHSFLDSNLGQIAKVKQSLEALASLLVDTYNPTSEDINNNSQETTKSVS